MAKNPTRLAAHYAASVKTTDTQVVASPLGPVTVPVEVFVERGGDLPDNMAEGEVQRLKDLGAFDDLPPYVERLRAQGARLASDTAPQGEASEKPGIVVPDVDDDDLPPPLPDFAVDERGRVSPDVAHGTAPQDEAVQPDPTQAERFAAAQEQAKGDAEAEAQALEHQARAQRASAAKKSAK